MPKSFEDLALKVDSVAGFVSRVQIDVMDGKFVPERTWPYFSYHDSEFVAILSESAGLPLWDKIDYEVDLMVSTPETDVFDWIKAGVKRVILHIESTEELVKLIGEIRAEFGNPKESEFAPEIGIAANNDTSFEELEEFVSLADFIQVMGIARIGYQGEKFDERAISRITQLRKKFPGLIISVDGGVNNETAPRLVEAGASRLVSGSYLFKSLNIKEAIETLRNS